VLFCLTKVLKLLNKKIFYDNFIRIAFAKVFLIRFWLKFLLKKKAFAKIDGCSMDGKQLRFYM